MRRVLLCAALVVFLSACGNDRPTMTAEETAQAILETVEFSDSLLPADGDVAAAYYGLNEDIAEWALYISGTGATAEEIAVLRVGDGASSDAAKEAVQERIARQLRMLDSYNPAEAAKLRDALVVTGGDRVIFVCCPEPGQAREAVNALG